jgi:DNA ligase-1
MNERNNNGVDAESIQNLQMICEGISKQRAIDLLEAANFSLERAIDIFFHQQHQHEEQETKQNKTTTTRTTTTCNNSTSSSSVDPAKKMPLPPSAAEKVVSSSPIAAAAKTTNKARGRTSSSSLKKRVTSSLSPDHRANKQTKMQSFFGSSAKKTTVEHKTDGGATIFETKSIIISKAISIDDDDDDDDDTRCGPAAKEQPGSVSAKPERTIPSESQPSSAAFLPESQDTKKSDNNNKIVIIDDNSHTSTTSSSKQGEVVGKGAAVAAVQPQPQTQSQTNKQPPEFQEETSFQRLTDTLQQMTDTTKRLVKLAVLETFIRNVIAQHGGDDLDETTTKILTYSLQLVLGRPSSNDQAPLEVSGSAVSKGLQTILGVSRMQFSRAYRKHGDLGDVAASFFQKRSFFVATKIKYLSIVDVYTALQEIVRTSGRDAKQHIVLQLMRKCQSKTELRFLVRLLVSNMRVGANLKTVLAALAMAIGPQQQQGGGGGGSKEESDQKKANIERVQKTHDICPNLERIIGALLRGGVEQMVKDCGIQVLTPIGPMLAHPIHTLDQIEKAMNEKQTSMTMEWKYDGVRCQAHYDGTTAKLFSRNMLESTAQYPDAAKNILEATCDASSVTSFIIDSEIVGVEGEGEEERLLPFQDLSKRKKKNDDGSGVRVKVFAFDLMHLNGVSYVERPLWERQQALRAHFQKTNDFDYVSSEILDSYDETKLRNFLEEAVRKGAEGLMLKMLGKSTANGSSCENRADNVALDDALTSSSSGDILDSSPYEAGTRSHSWLKVKRDYVAGYADTIDVVPIGAW